MTVHGCTVRSHLTGCQVTSRPGDQFSRYSKLMDTLGTAFLYDIYFIFLTEYSHTSVVPPGHAMPQPPPAPFPAGSRIPPQPEITLAYGLPPTQAPAYLVHGKVGGKSGISCIDRMCWNMYVLPLNQWPSIFCVASNVCHLLLLFCPHMGGQMSGLQRHNIGGDRKWQQIGVR